MTLVMDPPARPTAEGGGDVQRCRGCGCTDRYGCGLDGHERACQECWWIEDALCSACEGMD